MTNSNKEDREIKKEKEQPITYYIPLVLVQVIEGNVEDATLNKISKLEI